MEELLISITKGLVDNPDAVSVDVNEPDEEGVVVYHLHVAAATRRDAKISIEID